MVIKSTEGFWIRPSIIEAVRIASKNVYLYTSATNEDLKCIKYECKTVKDAEELESSIISLIIEK